jgi:isochorismate synthase EntC
MHKGYLQLCIKKHKGKVIKNNPITEEKNKEGEKDTKILKPEEWKKLIQTAITTEEQEYTKVILTNLLQW